MEDEPAVRHRRASDERLVSEALLARSEQIFATAVDLVAAAKAIRAARARDGRPV